MMRMKILIYRKDNIGDLVLTLPLVFSLRASCGECEIDAFTSSYSRAVAEHCPLFRTVYAYRKSKHLRGWAKLRALLDRLVVILKLRENRYDLLIFPGNLGQNKNRWVVRIINAQRSVGFFDEPPLGPSRLPAKFTAVPNRKTNRQAEWREILRLSVALRVNLSEPPEPPYLELRTKSAADQPIVVGIHLSARRPSQRWARAHFFELIQGVLKLNPQIKIVVTWSPGTSSNPVHPGDDEAAKSLRQLFLEESRVEFHSSQSLDDLLAIQRRLTALITPDGGAMHCAAALGIRCVALFGDSDPKRWAPVGRAHILLQGSSGHVDSIQPEQVLAALSKVLYSSL